MCEEETVLSDAGESLKLHYTGPETQAKVHEEKELCTGAKKADRVKSNVLPAQRAARPGGREPQRRPLCCSAGPRS